MAHGGARQNAGRKTKDDEKRIRDITSPYCTDAIQIVVEILNCVDEKASDRIAAAKLLLAYAYGQPTQNVDQHNTLSINDFDITKLYKTSDKEME